MLACRCRTSDNGCRFLCIALPRIAVRRRLRTVLLLSLLLVLAYPAAAQQRPLSLTGGVGFSAEAYGVSGIDSRRAPTLFEGTADLGFNLYGLTSGFSLTYSSDQSQLRQSINRFAFRSAWTWGRVELGDVHPQFSSFSLSGTAVRGGLVEVTPGPFHLEFTGGQSRRAVEPVEASLMMASYRQMTYGSRVGVGEQSGSHFHLIGVYVRDVVRSLDSPFVDAGPLAGDDGFFLAPQANVSITPDVGVSLLGRRLFLESQVTVSMMTRDLTAPDLDGAPSFLPIRRSSHVDYAGEAAARLNMPMVSVNASYQRVEPGFESLGIPQMRNDQERIRIQPTLNLLDRRLSVGFNAAHSRNNLQKHRVATAKRLQLGSNVRAQITEQFMLSGSFARLTNSNDPLDSAPDPVQLQQYQVSQTFTLAPALNIGSPGGTMHTVAVSGSLQSTADRSDAVALGLREAFTTRSTSTNATYSVQLDSGIQLNANGNYVWSDAANSTTSVVGLNAGGGTSLMDGLLQVDVSAGWSRNRLESTMSTQASLALISPSLDFSGYVPGVTTDADLSVTDRARVPETIRDRSAYAWLISDMVQGTGGEDAAMLEWMFARGIYDAAMLEELTQAFQSISSQWTGTLGSTYRLPNGDRLRLIFRGLVSSSDEGRTFREGRITLQFEHRF